MKGIPIITRIAALAAVIVGAAAAFALPAGADVGILSPPIASVQIGSPATLGTRGVTVTVPVTVLCAAGGHGEFLNVEVVQAVGGNIARGVTSVDTGPCTGSFQTFNVVVVADEHPFRRGTALATAQFLVCDNTGCLFNSHQREIRIR